MFFKKEIKILAPCDGEIVGIEHIPDDEFSVYGSGTGVAVIPQKNEIYAPVTGVITSLFPTLHAIGITTKEGLELLVHVGINTVNMGGDGFEAKVSKQTGVRRGNLILTADFDKIKQFGCDIITPIIICNPKDFKEISYSGYGRVKKGDVIMTVKL